MNNKCGIYAIKQIGTPNIYIGSSSDLVQRFSQHRRLLRAGKHHARHLQNAWNKYGEYAFSFEVWEECSVDKLLEREQHYINAFKPIFNVAPVAGTRRGVPQPQWVNELVSRIHRGKPKSPEHRAKISAAQKGVQRPYLLGHKVSAETRAKIGAANKGKPHGYYGRHLPEETKRKLSEAQKGVPRPYLLGHKVSVESRAKMSAAMKGNKNGLGKVCSDEKRAKIRASNLGQKRSPEARERMRQSRLAYLAKQKGNLS